jgi:urease accessory protein
MNLCLLQLGDSALPIGGFSQSWGLEAAVERGLVRDAIGLETWVRYWLRYIVGPLDGVIVAVTCAAFGHGDSDTLAQANQLVRVSLAPPTLRNASREMGEQLAGLAEAWPWASVGVARLRQQPAIREWHHAPVFGTLAGAAGASACEAVTVYLHQAVLGCIGAGVRAIPVGHTHGQQILARVHDEILDLAADLANRDLETAGSFSPAYEMLCHAQSQLYTRLFRS